MGMGLRLPFKGKYLTEFVHITGGEVDGEQILHTL